MKRKAKKPLTVAAVLRISNIYSKVNNKHINYGDMVALINRNIDQCVCCGEIVPEGRHVCPLCEGVVE